MSAILNLVPTPRAVVNAVVGTAINAVDAPLSTLAQYSEKVEHVFTPVTRKTELIHGDESDGDYHGRVARSIELLREQIHKGLPIILPLTTAASLVDALVVAKATGGQDDRLFLMEHVLVFLSRYPEKSVLGKQLKDTVMSVLYNDLPHPPASVVGNDPTYLQTRTEVVKDPDNPGKRKVVPKLIVGRDYRWRAPDGYGTSIWDPELGKAGSPYARTVQGTHPLSPHDLPSPELLFDALLKREKQEVHPAGLSSLFFAFANIIIHQLFWTNPDPSIPKDSPQNLTSSYLDLSILYGNDLETQKKVRLNDGTGQLKPDTIADYRLLFMPPSTGAFAVLFSRNHNYIAEKLLEINERGNWSWPPKDPVKQDDEIFNTARLVNCGYFMNVILSDYLGAILGTVREGNSWSLDPLSMFRNQDSSVSARGQGNVVSIEFAALYRFHAPISTKDEAWVEDLFRSKEYFGPVGWDEITPRKYGTTLKKAAKKYTNDPSDPPETWTIEGLTRDSSTGRYKDADLARVLQSATTQPASPFGGRNTPHVLRVVEVIAIQHFRNWGACSLNEFRSFLGLRPYKTFEEWNPNPEIAEAARRLYVHPDNIELYVGLQAEDTKPVMPGTGLCAVTRAILSDAVALVRGDRFLTNDFTSFNLTAWGYNDAQRNRNNSANGGMLNKLLLRALPDFYPDNSTFTNFPLMTPTAMKSNLTRIGTAHKYTFDLPLRRRPLKVIKSLTDAELIFDSPDFKTEYHFNATQIFPPFNGYLLSIDSHSQNAADRRIIRNAFANKAMRKKHISYLYEKTLQLIHVKSYSLSATSKRSVDVVRDVINLLPVHFVADHVIGLPLKSETHQFGSFFEKELYEKLRDVYTFIFIQNDPTTHLARQDSAKDVVDNLVRLTAHHFTNLGLWGFIPGFGLIDNALHLLLQESKTSHEWFAKLRESTRPALELVNDVVSLAVVLSVELSQILTHVVDSFLAPGPLPYEPSSGLTNNKSPQNAAGTDPKGQADTNKAPQTTADPPATASSSGSASRSVPSSATAAASARARAINGLVNTNDEDSIKMLSAYILEAIRLRPAVPGVYRDASADVTLGDKTYQRGDRLYISIKDAQRDPKGDEFATNPKVPPTLLGDGLIRLMGQEWVVDMCIPVIKAIFRLGGVARAPGASGILSKFVLEVPETDTVNAKGEKQRGVEVDSYMDKSYVPSPWANSLTINYTE